MKIEHIAMYVNDLEAARDFFIKYLGGSSNDGYHNAKTGFRSYFISFEDGARLEIMNKPGLADPKKDLNRTGYAHIAFSLGNKEAVDLGLSVKWASCNVGANSPEEYGNYYGWGDITGQHIAKGSDNWFFLDYQFPPRSTSDTISNSIVNTKYDMAKANWGNGWRLPTVEEIGELISNCSISEITTNGKRCYKITGINGQCIILPRAGLRSYDSEYYAKGEDLYIWSGNLSYIQECSDEHRQLAFALEISDSTRNGSRIPGIKIELEHLYRWDGISVRAVKDK